jgi:hypothetical protein
MNDAQRRKIAERQRAMVANSEPGAPGEDETPPPPAPQKPALEEIAYETRPEVPRGIPVKFVRFVDRSMQISGMQSGEQLQARKEPNNREHRIEYIPEMRHHMITYLDPAKHEVHFDFVHESQVKSWKPV